MSSKAATSQSFTAHGSHFYNLDCVEGAQAHLDDGSIDLIVTDPPYGIDGSTLHQHYNRDERFVVDGYVEVPADEYGDFSLEWVREAERVLRPGGSIYIVSGYTNLHHIIAALQKTSLREVNHIIWKYNFGVYTSRKFVSSHYHILYYEKPGGRRTFNLESRYSAMEKDDSGGSRNYQDREDVWLINREYKPGQIKNKNELPSALLTKILQYSSNEGDLVCDFFLGGFSTAKVALGLRRRFVGFEISKDIFGAKQQELNALQPGALLAGLPQPQTTLPPNQGKEWSEEEVKDLVRRFEALQDQGKTKYESVSRLANHFGRGQWSIQKALAKGLA